MPLDPDRARGLLLGLALGDALGMPITGLSHINVRTYYKGIKGLRADEKRGDLGAGQWTLHTQRALALSRAMTGALVSNANDLDRTAAAFAARLDEFELRRPASLGRASSAVAACAAPLGLWWAATEAPGAEARRWVRTLLAQADDRPDALVAGIAQAAAVRHALSTDPAEGAMSDLVEAAVRAAQDAEVEWDGASGRVSARLADVGAHLDEFPLDLQDRCDGSDSGALEAFPFALAMAARGPGLVEATLLSAVNVGGDASAIGAVAGSLLGAMNGAEAFPTEWLDGLEDSAALRTAADRLLDAVV